MVLADRLEHAAAGVYRMANGMNIDDEDASFTTDTFTIRPVKDSPSERGQRTVGLSLRPYKQL